VDVAYGANGKFKFKSGVTGKITFDDATFGDPIKGVRKSGFYRAAKNQGPSGYSFAVKEGQTVAVPSLTTVVYGANGAFSYKYNRTSDIDCTSEAFGEDPAPGVAKPCFVNPISTPQGYDFAVNEGTRVKVSGTVNVAFGANGQFVWKYNQTSDIACTRQAFESDPLPGATKRCYTRQVSSPNPTPSPNPNPNNCSGVIAVAKSDRTEVNLNNTNCVKFADNLSGSTLAAWDSDANSSCDFRGTVSSNDGVGQLNVTSNYASSTALSGRTFSLTPSNGCKFVKVRYY